MNKKALKSTSIINSQDNRIKSTIIINVFKYFITLPTHVN